MQNIETFSQSLTVSFNPNSGLQNLQAPSGEQIYCPFCQCSYKNEDRIMHQNKHKNRNIPEEKTFKSLPLYDMTSNSSEIQWVAFLIQKKQEEKKRIGEKLSTYMKASQNPPTIKLEDNNRAIQLAQSIQKPIQQVPQLKNEEKEKDSFEIGNFIQIQPSVASISTYHPPNHLKHPKLKVNKAQENFEIGNFVQIQPSVASISTYHPPNHLKYPKLKVNKAQEKKSQQLSSIQLERVSIEPSEVSFEESLYINKYKFKRTREIGVGEKVDKKEPENSNYGLFTPIKSSDFVAQNQNSNKSFGHDFSQIYETELKNPRNEIDRSASFKKKTSSSPKKRRLPHNIMFGQEKTPQSMIRSNMTPSRSSSDKNIS